ncbi:TPA: DUF2971 domain-containing protein, partial [Legionella pneumophila]|nr:DUF2971 domain-containing protein [Legionella pneumophila]
MVANITEELIKKAEKISDEATKSLDCYHDIPHTLYHFTNLDSLISILENKTVRFTHYKYLNDETELNFAWENITEFLLKDKINIPVDVIDHLKNITTIINKRKNTYIFCLSKILDNLAMWRMYADDGFGVAIGFDSDVEPEQNPRHVFSPTIAKTVYDMDYPSELKNLFIFIEENSHKIQLPQCKGSNVENELKFFNYLGVPLQILSMINKHPSFRLEEEIRLLLFDGELAPNGFNYPEQMRYQWSKCINHPDLNIINFNDGSYDITLRQSTYQKT